MSRLLDCQIHALIQGECTEVPPHYSTVGAVALAVMDKMQASGWSVSMRVHLGDWRVRFDYCNPRNPLYGASSTLGSGGGYWPEYYGAACNTFAAAVCDAVLATRTVAEQESMVPRTVELL